MASTSNILYCSSDSSLVLIDIPRSIEESQGQSSSRRLISSNPQEVPFTSLEPKSVKAKANASPISLEDLLLSKRLEFTLQELRDGYEGLWYLPRITEDYCLEATESTSSKRQKSCYDIEKSPERNETSIATLRILDTNNSILYHNPRPTSTTIQPDCSHGTATIPPRSTALSGGISSTLPTFITSAPFFSLIVLDPPWPNRSARRSKSYSTSYSTPSIHQLLSSIPLEDRLVSQGLIAIWITNKAAFREMVIGEGELFEQWGVVLVEEWIWLKITKSGEPICALDSTWRKPYEVLLVGRRGGAVDGEVKRRVMVGVPDLHSRKPNLKSVFERVSLLEKDVQVDCLEIFARNLTAGWWGWGNEVLKFQMEECWIDPPPTLVQSPIVTTQDI